MALKELTRTINGKEMFCRQLPATRSMVAKAKLMKMGGEYMLPFFMGEANLYALTQLEQHADPEELINLFKELACTVRIEGKEVKPATFDIEYTDLWEIAQIFAFACEVNYKDFFEQGLESLNDH